MTKEILTQKLHLLLRTTVMLTCPKHRKEKAVSLWHSLVGSQAAGVQVALDSVPPPGLAGPCAYAAVTATGTPHRPPTHLPLLQRSAERGKREISTARRRRQGSGTDCTEAFSEEQLEPSRWDGPVKSAGARGWFTGNMGGQCQEGRCCWNCCIPYVCYVTHLRKVILMCNTVPARSQINSTVRTWLKDQFFLGLKEIKLRCTSV